MENNELPEGYENWSIHDKRNYRMRVVMRKDEVSKNPILMRKIQVYQEPLD